MSLGSSHPSLYSDFSSSSLDKDVERMAQSVVSSIWQAITEAENTMTIEKSNFAELGSYLYRALPVILELRTTSSVSPELPELLQDLSSNIDLAKDLLINSFCGIREQGERGIILERLEGVSHKIGYCLSSIPSSAFKNSRYAAIAAKSISRDMTEARFYSDEIITKISPQRRSQDEKEASTSDSDAPALRLVDYIAGMHYSSREEHSRSEEYLASPAAQIDPPYESFFCPLTMKMMEDPVTLETGITFERAAIQEWLQRFEIADSPAVCPVTGKILKSRAMNKNLALATMIGEWKERNEAARIKLARISLSKNASDTVVLEALADLRFLCWSRKNKVDMCNSGMVPLLARFMQQKNRKIRFEAMETLRLLIQENEEGKDLVASTNATVTSVKFLSSRHLREKLSSVSFLLELSKSEKLCENIGSVSGAIVMLLAMKNDKSLDPSISVKAEKTLQNLKKFSKNVGVMAENGYLDPLLDDLIHGPEETKTEMLGVLGEIHLGEESITLVAERASWILMAMVRGDNSQAKRAAVKILTIISSYQSCCQALVNADLPSVMTDALFSRKNLDESTDTRADSAAILVNLLKSGVDPEEIQVGPQYQTMGSDFFIKNTCRILCFSQPLALTENLVRILISLMERRRPALSTVNAIKQFDCLSTLLEFLNSSQDGLSAVAMEFLIKLCPFIGHAIAGKLCKTRGQPQTLIENLQQSQRSTKRKELTAMLLSKLPHRNVELNLSLLRLGSVAILIRELRKLQREESIHENGFFEGLVGSLVRFTATLHEEEVILMASELNLTAVFSAVVGGAGGEEVKRLAATALENLSGKSRELSLAAAASHQRKPKLIQGILKTGKKPVPCGVHGGICSSSSTFCLVEAGAVEGLLNCVETGGTAAEAAMAAICTLLEETAEGAVAVLAALGAVGRVLEVVRRRRKEEELIRRCLWFLERVLVHGKEEIRREISADKALPSVLMGVVCSDDISMRQAAELVLRRLNRIPDVSISMAS